MAQRRIVPSVGWSAVGQVVAAGGGSLVVAAGAVVAPGVQPAPAVDRATLATAVRFLLQELGERAPGRSVEVRVPPFGAVQCIEGTSHRRGTPPAVIEMDAETWILLGAGELLWADALKGGRVQASGERADLSGLLPLMTREQRE